MRKIDVNQFMTEILDMWTETDTAARRAAIESHFDESVTFHDPDGELVGHDGIEAFSDSLQRRFPGARFKFAATPQMLGNAIRGIWQFGPPYNPDAISGMDFAIWDGRRVTALYAFVDKPLPPIHAATSGERRASHEATTHWRSVPCLPLTA